MEEVVANFVENSRGMTKVILQHNLFGTQTFKCDHLKIIDDDYRKGVVIKGREIFVYKRNIIKETDNMVTDGMLTITIY